MRDGRGIDGRCVTGRAGVMVAWGDLTQSHRGTEKSVVMEKAGMKLLLNGVRRIRTATVRERTGLDVNSGM